jgi:glutathione synthase/RimK-type ligase-like ATP-grasp enzyme
MKLYSYHPESRSAKSLSAALGIKRIKHEGKLIHVDTLINWGATQIKRAITFDNVLNNPEAVQQAVCKLKTFNALKLARVRIPEFTTDSDVAFDWVKKGVTIIARTKLNGHSGEGIEILEPGDHKEGIPHAPLYVRYIPKKQEYRVHVFQGHAFFVQRKARNNDIPDDKVNWKVRNHGNGFIFAHQGVAIGAEGELLAIQAVQALGLDFGAVDLIYNEKTDMYYVLEVNTACGMEGTTLDKYVEQFKKVM